MPTRYRECTALSVPCGHVLLCISSKFGQLCTQAQCGCAAQKHKHHKARKRHQASASSSSSEERREKVCVLEKELCRLMKSCFVRDFNELIKCLVMLQKAKHAKTKQRREAASASSSG